MNIQVRFGQQALEFAILQLQLAQAFGLAGIHPAVLGAPFIKAGVTKAVFAADLLDRHTGLGLPDRLQAGRRGRVAAKTNQYADIDRASFCPCTHQSGVASGRQGNAGGEGQRCFFAVGSYALKSGALQHKP